jgi:hypothetical protein
MPAGNLAAAGRHTRPRHPRHRAVHTRTRATVVRTSAARKDGTKEPADLCAAFAHSQTWAKRSTPAFSLGTSSRVNSPAARRSMISPNCATGRDELAGQITCRPLGGDIAPDQVQSGSVR